MPPLPPYFVRENYGIVVRYGQPTYFYNIQLGKAPTQDDPVMSRALGLGSQV